jgi:manganese/zinc/iron transport system permease protein
LSARHSISDAQLSFPTYEHIIRVLTLEDYNTRVVVFGVMALGTAAGLVGTFLLLRKRALTADALSHATLPGLAIAFMIMVALGSEGKSLAGLLIGAFVFGCIGVLLILAIHHTTRLKDDAAIGIVLSVFFGLGICLLRLASELPEGSASGLGGFIFGKAASMIAQDAITMAVVALVVGGGITLLHKELTLLCFDEQFGSVQGWKMIQLDVVLMVLVAIVTVIALQSVGLVLAVALLIIPAASARYWTRGITSMLIAAALIGCLSGWLGATVSALIPRMPTGPIIVLVCGFWFFISFVFGSNNGLVITQIQRVRLNRRIAMQHILRAMWEVCEGKESFEFEIDEVVRRRSWSKRFVQRVLKKATKRKYAFSLAPSRWLLTQRGIERARQVVRNHRLWEVYLINYADIAPSHVDRDADMIEHVLGQQMVEKLESILAAEQIPKSPHPIVGGS